MTKNSPLEKPQALGRNAPSVATRANPTATSMREGSQGLLRRSAASDGSSSAGVSVSCSSGRSRRRKGGFGRGRGGGKRSCPPASGDSDRHSTEEIAVGHNSGRCCCRCGGQAGISGQG